MKSIIDVLTFRINAVERLKDNKEQNRFNHALNKMLSRTNEIEKTYNEFLEDSRVELASEDDKKNLIVNDKNSFVFSKENHKKLNDKIREKRKEEVKIEPYFVAKEYVPKDLSLSLQEVFLGFVIESIEEPEFDDDKKEGKLQPSSDESKS